MPKWKQYFFWYGLYAFLFVLILFVFSGCAEYTGAVKERGAQGSDSTVDAAVWALCNAAPVGGIRREFNSPEKAKTWQELCSESDFDPAP